MTQRVPKKFYLVPRSLMYVNVCIKCVCDMDWKSSVNLGTHCHHYSFLASTLKLDSSQQGARWEIVQQRQRNAPKSLSVLDGCRPSRPELLKPRDVLYKSEREGVVQTERTCNIMTQIHFIIFFEFSFHVYNLSFLRGDLVLFQM